VQIKQPWRMTVLGILASVVVVLMCASGGRTSQPAVPLESLFVVTHIDVMPPFAKPAVELLRSYVKDSSAEKGAEKIEALQQDGRPNHFTVVEQWHTKQDYDTHLSNEKTCNFRAKLQPMLGSPFDERLHWFIN
jgi:quinol monooxygenase YgiN